MVITVIRFLKTLSIRFLKNKEFVSSRPRVFRLYALWATSLIEWPFSSVECHFSVVEWPFRIVEWPFRNVKRHSTTLKGCSTRKSLRARVYIHDS